VSENTSKIKRRGFVKICATVAAAVGASPELLANNTGEVKRYNRVMLVDAEQRPLTVDDIRVGETYVFNYPYVTTPCFLLNLGRTTPRSIALETESGREYVWPGGCGPERSIVSFCAICAHKMTHPARSVSFINYRHEEVSFKDADEQVTQRSQVIYCCSEKSVYDPANGARVLGGPAPQPLTTILLELDDATGIIYATGTSGGELYEEFFDKFGFRIALEHETSDIQKMANGQVEVVTIAEFTNTQVTC